MAVIINAYRQTLLGRGAPSYSSLLIATVVSIIFLLLGLAYFKSREKLFADNI